MLGAPLDTSLELPQGAAAETVKFEQFEATRIRLKVRSDRRGLLVMSEIFYPGWKAQVNGKDVPIWKMDGGLRGIVVPGGEGVVAVYYSPASFRAGGITSAAAFLGLTVLAFFGLRKRD